MKNRIVIRTVLPDSAAQDAGIEPGDLLLSINGQQVQDIFDYRFLTTDNDLLVEVEKGSGEIWEIEVDKDEYEDLGLEFDDPLISEAKSCTNKCVFCFIDQLPKGMRDTVYFKDDDSRLSFLSGNYITLTNLKDGELERIIRYRMTPVNVSVHTTNPKLRCSMLGNRFAGDILDKIRILTDGGITVNAQIVLCKGLNDGAELDRTLGDLASLYPGIASISVVPVGLTKWREGLYQLEPFDKVASFAVLEQVGRWQQKLLEQTGSRLVYLADEFYIKASAELPDWEEYEDFPQIENGVGLMSMLMHEFHEYLRRHGRKLDKYCSKLDGTRFVSIATGVCAYQFIKQLAQVLEKRYNNLKIEVYPIKNGYFGENVTVTGLLTGGDLHAQLKDQTLGSELLISRSMLKSGEELFLDDYTVQELETRLGSKIVRGDGSCGAIQIDGDGSCVLRTKVTIVENDGEDLIKKILGMK
jgi:putative radical SAM enzyme (TIGR03279 family)